MTIDVTAASIEVIQQAIGQNLHARIKREHGIKVFCERNGLATTTINRLSKGENITLPNLVRVLKGLGMTHVLTALAEPPPTSPIDNWQTPKPRRRSPMPQTASVSSAPLDPTGLAKKTQRGSRHAKP